MRVADEDICQPTIEPVPVQPDIEPEFEQPPPFEEQTPFVQNLFGTWMQYATFGPAHLERLLRVETWFLDGRYAPFHHEHRVVVLAKDYWTWESTLLRR